MAKIIARESVEIPAVRYTGVIDNVVIRDEQNKAGKPVQYVEMHVQTDVKNVKGWKGDFKVSYPTNLTKQTGLGKFLQRMGIPFVPGEEFDTDSLKGLRVSFDTVRDGYFTNPVLDGVGPADE